MSEERSSKGTVVKVVACIALLGACVAAAWFGRQVAAGYRAAMEDADAQA
jgi:hypothetical protein